MEEAQNLIVKSRVAVESGQNELPKDITVDTLAMQITGDYPQIVDGVPIYLITGSLAIKLALQAIQIDRMNIRVEPDHSVELGVQISYSSSDILKSEMASSPSLSNAPKDVDLIRANAGFSGVNGRWDRICLEKFPLPFGKIWYERPGGIPLLVEEMKPDIRFSPSHPVFRNWTSIWVNGNSYLTINPVAILAVRNFMPGRSDGIGLQETRDYMKTLSNRFPALYER